MKSLDWRILAALYEKRSITKTAAALYMTQSALTKRLKGIEAEWNICIAHRSYQGLTFTEDGIYLCRKAAVMLDFLQEIEDHFSNREHSKEPLRIGAPNAVARLYLPGLLKWYQQEHDTLQIQTSIGSSDRLLLQLLEGGIDIAIVCGDFSYVGERVMLFSENLYVLSPRGVKFDDLDKLPYIESFLNPVVKPLAEQWWRNRFGSPCHPAHSVPHQDIAIEMVENGLGVTMLFGDCWSIDEEKTQLIPALDNAEHPICRPVWMLISDRCFQSQSIADFISATENFFHANGNISEDSGR